MNKKKYCIFLILLLCCFTGILAQKTNDTVVSKKFPVHFSPIYPLGIHGQESKKYTYNFSLTLIAGMVRSVNGAHISGLYSQATGYVNGLQFAGLGGNSAGNLKGIQIGGVTNANHLKMRGIQISGFANAATEADGVQISGFVNAARNVKGIQIAGVGSGAENMTGIQIGGISTLTQRKMTGLQISGTYNRADTLRGVSISVVSFSDTIEKGFSLSLVNIVKKGSYRELELSFADYANVALSYKMGTQKFYTIYTTGISFIEDKLWINGIGFGNRTAIGNRFDFQPELLVHSFLPTNSINLKNIKDVFETFETRLKLGFVYCINKKMGLSFAPSIYVKSDNNNITRGLGANLGLKIKI